MPTAGEGQGGDHRKRVLIVDDEPSIRDSLRLLLRSNFDVQVAGDGREALEAIEHEAPDLVLLDVIMPQLGGLETLKEIRSRNIDVPVVMLTATTTVQTAVQAMKCGAVDFINKPFDVTELTSLIVTTLEHREMTPAIVVETESNAPVIVPADFGPMVGQSSSMTDLFNRIEQVAARDTTVLITGESGTGKELIAREIHHRSTRSRGPFVAINCAAIPESLIESELFGHERGAFTHAVERRLGHFELAHGGTLFLDEIGELSLAVQVKLLRFLQEQEFYRVGRSKPIQVNVRVITATNRNLEELIAEKRFRADLFYRINVVGLPTPPLRDRFEDIPLLVQYFVHKLSPRYGGRRLTFTPAALEMLVEYHWPGNVRELENMIESLMALSVSDEVSESMMPKKLLCRAESEALRPRVFSPDMKFEDAERMFESEMILKALKKTNWVQTRAAELLGISRRILKYKMDKLGISEVPPTALPAPIADNEPIVAAELPEEPTSLSPDGKP